MGVLSCDRAGCENIMCDSYSYEYGYICNECFDEICSLGVNTDIHKFMRTARKYEGISDEDPYDKFRKIFKLRN